MQIRPQRSPSSHHHQPDPAEKPTNQLTSREIGPDIISTRDSSQVQSDICDLHLRLPRHLLVPARCCSGGLPDKERRQGALQPHNNHIRLIYRPFAAGACPSSNL